MATKVDRILKLAEAITQKRLELSVAEEELRKLAGGRRARTAVHPAKKKKKKLSEFQLAIYKSMTDGVMTLAEVANACAFPEKKIHPRLSEMKTMGYVESPQPKHYRRIS